MTYSANPDLVVLDYTLPLMSGLEVLKMFRQTPATADLPVAVGQRGGRRFDGTMH